MDDRERIAKAEEHADKGVKARRLVSNDWAEIQVRGDDPMFVAREAQIHALAALALMAVVGPIG